MSEAQEASRQSDLKNAGDVVVMKFGGTSVENEGAIERLIDIVKRRLRTSRPVVVVSALSKVTDQLLEAGEAAALGHLGAALESVRKMHVRHDRVAGELIGGDAFNALDRELRGLTRALESLLQEVSLCRELSPESKDLLLGFGERLSSHLVAAALREAGVASAHLDAGRCIVTDNRHGQAGPLWALTNQRLFEGTGPLLEAEQVPVMGGYIASTQDGVPTTLGRGGSDFTAAIVGAALHASRIEIWTDVDGIMTTDPKLCPDARVIRQMNFEEAAELAHFGAKVLHPSTIAPAMRKNIPVYVLNSKRPEGKGTEIVARVNNHNTVSAITAKRKIATVEIEAQNGIDAELLRSIYSIFDQHHCPVDIMATSLGRVSLLVGSAADLPAIAVDLQRIANVSWENHKALVCLVGENIRRQPEVASLALAAVSDMDIRLVCQGASDCTVSFLVEESKADESVQRLHELFFPLRQQAEDWGGSSAAFCQAAG
jgi:aspartate kinase